MQSSKALRPECPQCPLLSKPRPPTSGGGKGECTPQLKSLLGADHMLCLPLQVKTRWTGKQNTDRPGHQVPGGKSSGMVLKTTSAGHGEPHAAMAAAKPGPSLQTPGDLTPRHLGGARAPCCQSTRRTASPRLSPGWHRKAGAWADAVATPNITGLSGAGQLPADAVLTLVLGCSQ